jgi:hypothetical protein
MNQLGAGEANRTPDPNLGKDEIALFLKITGNVATFFSVQFAWFY